jgi:hypothetical protein
MAGETRPPSDQVVATHTQLGGDLALHLADGSSLLVVGTTHIDFTMFH